MAADAAFGTAWFLFGVRRLGLETVVGMRRDRRLRGGGRLLDLRRQGSQVYLWGLSFPVWVAWYRYPLPQGGWKWRYVVATRRHALREVQVCELGHTCAIAKYKCPCPPPQTRSCRLIPGPQRACLHRDKPRKRKEVKVYPVWEGFILHSAFLVAIVAVAHILFSHVTVAATWFNWWVERKALLENKPYLMDYLKASALKLLVLAYTVGAMFGVGIWFSVTASNPRGISTLIHNFVFYWASEWFWFIIDVFGIAVYYYTFGRVNPRTHARIGSSWPWRPAAPWPSSWESWASSSPPGPGCKPD